MSDINDDRAQLSPTTIAEQNLGRETALANAKAIAAVAQANADKEAAMAAATDPAELEAEKEKATADAVRDYSAGQEVKPVGNVKRK